MADWYCSSTQYSGYTAWAATTAHVIGDLIKPTAPGDGAKYVFRCTTAGTTSSTEPTWPQANNGAVTDGTAHWANVTGQSTYGWSGAAGDVLTLMGNGNTLQQRPAGSDRVFISSDHAETVAASNPIYGSAAGPSNHYAALKYLSVNKAGSVPPVAADLTVGASITVAGSSGNSLLFGNNCQTYYWGITCALTASGSADIDFGDSLFHGMAIFMQNCAVYLDTANAASRYQEGGPCGLILDNTTLQFSHASQAISEQAKPLEIEWRNTPSAVPGGTLPTVLFNPGGGVPSWFTFRGVDLSAITGTLVNSSAQDNKYYFDSCKIASGVTRLSLQSNICAAEEVVLVNCYDGTNIISERHTQHGDVTTEFTITLSGGAQDDVGSFSHKMVSNTNIDKWVNQLCGFWMDVNNTAIGSSRTASVEIISSGTLNTDEIALYVEYPGTSGSPVTSMASSMVATPLSSGSAVSSSSATWNSSPSTPQKQTLAVTFTPQTAGRIRGQIRLGKASTTVYYNPQMTIT